MGKIRIAAGNTNGPTEINLTAMILDTIRLVTKTAVMMGSQRCLGISLLVFCFDRNRNPPANCKIPYHFAPARGQHFYQII